MLKGSAVHGAKKIRVHILTDGRDVLDGSSVGFLETLENDLVQLRERGIDAQVASGGGRMYVTMDRYEVSTLSEMQNILLDRCFTICLILFIIFYCNFEFWIYVIRFFKASSNFLHLYHTLRYLDLA